MATSDVSRDVQSDLHDQADALGEKVAREQTLGPQKGVFGQTVRCTCMRYSVRSEDGYIHFWYSSDPGCKYSHLQPLPVTHKVKL